MSRPLETDDPSHQSAADGAPTVGPGAVEDMTNYVTVNQSPEFAHLRRTFRRFVFPMTAIFLIWYFLFVLLSNYAPSFMSHEVIGNIHLGLIIGLGQFVSTFVITMVYARWADRTFDPMADAVAAQVTGLDTPGVTR